VKHLAAFGDYNNAKTCPDWDNTMDDKSNLADILRDVTSSLTGKMIHPMTYTLPRDMATLREKMESDKEKVFILKPTDKQECDGVRPVKHLHLNELEILGSGWIVQEYIMAPFLLAKRKFDLRLWLMLTTTDPPRAYLYTNSMVRLAHHPYSLDISSFRTRGVHLTIRNHDVARPEGEEGQIENIRELGAYIDRTKGEGTFEAVWKEIEHVVAAGFGAVVETMVSSGKGKHGGSKLYGIDLMLDSDYRPYLIEINKAAGTNHGHFTFIQPLVSDLFALILGSAKAATMIKDEERAALFSHIPSEALDGLTDAEIQRLASTLREHEERGDFKLIYPHPSHVAAGGTHATNLDGLGRPGADLNRENKALHEAAGALGATRYAKDAVGIPRLAPAGL